MGTLAAPSITSTARGPISGIDGRQAVAIHTDGTQIAAYKDGSVSLANIKVATSANNGDTWTQVANITAPVDTDYIAIGQFADGSIALVARSYDAITLRYAKVTYGTWAVSAWETILTIAAGGTLGFYDVDVSDTGVVLVAFQYKSGATLSAQVRARGTGGSWANLGSITMYTAGARRVSMEDISVVALASTGGILNAMVACASGTDVKDYGIRLWTFRVTESTGAIQTAYLLRSTFDANSVDLARTSGRQHRCRLFRVDGASEALLATWTIPNPTSGYGPRAGHYRANWAASSYLVIRDHVFYATPPADATTISSVGISANANRDLVFHLVRTGGSSVSPRITGQVMTWDNEVNNDPDSVGRDFSYFATTSDVPIVAVSDGPRRNLALSRMDFIYQYYIQSNSTAPLVSMREVVPNPGGASAITSLTPADGSSNVVATPALKAVVDTEVQFSQSDYRIHFEFATDSTFTTNLIDYVQSTFKRKPVNGTSTPGVTVTFSDTLPDAYNLTLQTWFYRARLVDIFGNVGAWTPTQSFIVGHPPSITPVSPSGGGFYNWNGGVRTHTWNFWDPSSTDYQTAYELQIELEDGTVVFNSAKVSGAAKSQSITLAAQYKDVLLGWKARGYDSDDTAGQWSPLATYVLTDPTVATINDPTPNKVYATGIPTFLFTPTTGGGRSIRDYTVVVTQGKNIIWSKRVPAADIASGQQQAVKMDQGYLKNNQNYSMQVVITDSGNIQGSSPVVAFSTAWVPPAAPSGLVVNSSQYNKEDEGYVQVGWDDVNRDPDFVSWALYRKVQRDLPRLQYWRGLHLQGLLCSVELPSHLSCGSVGQPTRAGHRQHAE
jgi:hypothetical protein